MRASSALMPWRGEPQVVALAGLHPRGESVPFLLELALAGVEASPVSAAWRYQSSCFARVSGSMAARPAAWAAPAASFRASSACHDSARPVNRQESKRLD